MLGAHECTYRSVDQGASRRVWTASTATPASANMRNMLDRHAGSFCTEASNVVFRTAQTRDAARGQGEVALSRVRTRAGLYWAGRRLDNSDFVYFYPNEEGLAKDQRLHNLAATTTARTIACCD
jgi:hypothetical protein